MKNIDFNKINALLLDLDGTLINSEKAFFNSFRRVLNDNYGISITMDDYKKYELEQNAMLLKVLRNNFSSIVDVSDAEIMSFVYKDYENSFRKVIVEEEAINNFKLLRELKQKSIYIALVTTCRRYYLDILLDELSLNNLFDIIIAREDVMNLKPAPDAYIKALDYLGLDAECCLSLEDSKRGVDSALSANIPTIKVDNFTSIKYSDDRVIEEESANKVFKKMLKRL